MKIEIKNGFITDNSAECESGALFLETAQNAKFRDLAAQNGAKIITNQEAREILGIDENIQIIGITGTNGKTTTAAAIYSILLDLGYRAALCGTRGAFVNDKRIDEKGLTTSSTLKILSYLQVASREKCQFFVMEVSSHAIAQNRIEGLKFALKIFTNLTQDHLDYHKTFEEYAAVKSSFLMDESQKLINSDDKKIVFNFKNAFTYGIQNPATFAIKAYSLRGGIDALIHSPFGDATISSDLMGEFNLYNLLAAFAAVKILTKKDNDEIAKALENFGGVEGRVEVVSQNPLVIVDFAHTPDGIEKVLDALKNHELIVVFGAGGNRDKTKRPLMGKIVEKFAKISVITSDNPRDEEPDEIISQICAGFENPQKAIIEPDRKKAIKKALEFAQNGEIVAILGKGDETYQEIKGVKHPFSDKMVVCELLKEKNES